MKKNMEQDIREFEFDNKLQEEYNDNNNNKGMFKTGHTMRA